MCGSFLKRSINLIHILSSNEHLTLIALKLKIVLHKYLTVRLDLYKIVT